MVIAGVLTPLTAHAQLEEIKVIPIAIEQSYLEGRGLTRVDPSEFDGDNVTRDDDFTSPSYKHGFHTGKIFVAVFEAGPGRVYINGAVYDEFVQILEGRLILTPDGGDAVEFKQGCLLYTSPSPRDRTRSRMPSSA